MVDVHDVGILDDPWQWFGIDNYIFNVIIDPTPEVVTSENVHWAIEIDISDNTDIPDEKEIGLFRDFLLPGQPNGGSAFRWVTERPDYDGSTVVPTGELSTTNAIKWAEGMITEGSLGDPIRLININVAGGYGSLSGFNFSIDNTRIEAGNFQNELLFDVLEDQAMRVINRKIRLYAVLNNVFFNVWSGIVSKTSHTELKFNITCEDDFKNIHKTIPKNTANETSFPQIIEKQIGKVIPVTLGFQNKAKLLNISKQSDAVDIASSAGRQYKLTSFSIYSEQPQPDPTIFILRLITIEKQFASNELRLGFLRHVGAGDDQVVQIISNSATTLEGSVFVMNISLAESLKFTPIQTTTPFGASDNGGGTLGSYFEIFKFDSVYIVSDKDVSSFEREPGSGPVAVSFFNKDEERFVDVSEIVETQSTTDIEQTDRPGITAFSNLVDFEGNFTKLFSIEPEKITLAGTTPDGFAGVDEISNDFPAIGEEAPNIFDRVRTTKNTIVNRHTVNKADASTETNIDFEIFLPNNMPKIDYDAIYFLIDYDQKTVGANHATPKFSFDNFAKTLTSFLAIFIKRFIHNTTAINDGVKRTFRFIPGSHFNENAGATAQFLIEQDNMNLNFWFDSSKIFRAFPKVLIRLHTEWFPASAVPFTVTTDVFQVAVIGSKEVNVINDDLFIKTIGEKFDGSNGTENVQFIFKHILENYDLIDSSQISENNLSNRITWRAGRQLLDPKNSFTYLKELAMQSFTGLFPTRLGKRGFNTYRDQDKATILFSADSGTIIAGSISDFELTPINEVYNEFDLRYELNNANKDYLKSIFIKKTNESVFPTQFESELGGDATDTTYTSVTMVISTGAAEAKILFPASIPASYVVGKTISLDDSSGIGIIQQGLIVDIDVPTLTVSVTFENIAGYTDGQSTPTGTITIHASNILKWHTFVGGFSSYSTAKTHWDVCHNSFLRTNVVRALPDQFAKCNWYIEESNFNVGAPGDDSSVHKYMALLVEWATRQKETPVFHIPLTTDNVQLELLEPRLFKDQKFTAGETREGYISKIKFLPEDDEILIQLTLFPEDIESVTDCLIVESGLNTDTIVESGAEADTIVESGTC